MCPFSEQGNHSDPTSAPSGCDPSILVYDGSWISLVLDPNTTYTFVLALPSVASHEAMDVDVYQWVLAQPALPLPPPPVTTAPPTTGPPTTSAAPTPTSKPPSSLKSHWWVIAAPIVAVVFVLQWVAIGWLWLRNRGGYEMIQH